MKKLQNFRVLALCVASFSMTPFASEEPTLGINLAGVNDYNPAWVFVDAFRHARLWIPQQVEGGPWDTKQPLDIDANGWIASLQEGQAAGTLVFGNSEGHCPTGEYVCLYEGEGTLVFGLGASIRSQKPGRIVLDFNPQRGSIYLKITATNPQNPIRNIRVIMPGFEETYSSQIFHPDFLRSIEGFQVIRYMDFQHTNDSPNQYWKDRTTLETFSQATRRGVAIEYLVELSNRTGCHPWFCMPHLVDDEYVERFAQLVLEKLDPKLQVYLEYSNEVWNGQFEQARYARERGRELNLSDNEYQAQLFYHSKRSVEIFRIWEKVFGGNTRLVRVLAAQSANPWTGLQVMEFQDAYKHADALGVAPYFGGSLGVGENAEKSLTLSVEEILDACRSDIGKTMDHTRENAQNAAKKGLRLVAYEAGQHLVGVGEWTNNQSLTDLFIAANRHPLMKDRYEEYIREWQRSGGGLMAIFSHISSPSKWGSWGILEYQNQDIASAPKYQAVRQFIPAAVK